MEEISSKKQDSARRKALDNIPSGLDETYLRDLQKLEKTDDFEIGYRAFIWLLYCKRPLRLSHLATAAAIRPDYPFNDEQRLDENENIFDFCRSFINVDLQTDVIEFSHISVKEFFMAPTISGGRVNPYYRSASEGNAILMKACFMYLASPMFKVDTLSHLPNQQEILPKIKKKFQDPFTFYAVYEWPTHAKRIEPSDLTSDVLDFLTDRSSSFPAWRELWEVTDIREFRWWEADDQAHRESVLWSEKIVCELRSASRSNPGTPLYYATALGLRSVVHQLLTKGHKPDEFGGPGLYPLFVALENGNIDIAELLISNRANVNIKDQLKNETALHRAVAKRNTNVVRYLFDRTDADHAAHNHRGQAPLHLAVHMDGNGEAWFAEIIELLAKRDVNVKDSRGRTALHVAARIGCTESATYLLEHEANVDIPDHNGRTALHIAALCGQVPMVETLQNIANILISDNLGYTALHLAVQVGNATIAEKLSETLGDPLRLSTACYTAPPQVLTTIAQ